MCRFPVYPECQEKVVCCAPLLPSRPTYIPRVSAIEPSGDALASVACMGKRLRPRPRSVTERVVVLTYAVSGITHRQAILHNLSPPGGYDRFLGSAQDVPMSAPGHGRGGHASRACLPVLDVDRPPDLGGRVGLDGPPPGGPTLLPWSKCARPHGAFAVRGPPGGRGDAGRILRAAPVSGRPRPGPSSAGAISFRAPGASYN